MRKANTATARKVAEIFIFLDTLQTRELCDVLLLEGLGLGAADATVTCMGPYIDVFTPLEQTDHIIIG